MTTSSFGPFFSDVLGVRCTFPSLQDAVNKLGSGNATLVISEPLPLLGSGTSTSVTVGEGLSLLFLDGGYIDITPPPSKDIPRLTINGPIHAGHHAILRWATDFSLSINPVINPEVSVVWFGAEAGRDKDCSAAFNKAGALGKGITIRIPIGVFRLDKPIAFDGVNIKGTSGLTSTLQYTGLGTAVTIDGFAEPLDPSHQGDPVTRACRGFRVHCLPRTKRVPQPVISGLWIKGAQNVLFDDIEIWNAHAGVALRLAGEHNGVISCEFRRIRIHAGVDGEGIGILADKGDPPAPDGTRACVNANLFADCSVEGACERLIDLECGSVNTFVGGEVAPNSNGARRVAAVWRFGGRNNVVLNPYYEATPKKPVEPNVQPIAPLRIVEFGPESTSNRLLSVYGLASWVQVDDHGANNQVDIATAFGGYVANHSEQNLLPNSHFRNLDAATGLPVGWHAPAEPPPGNTGRWTRDSSVVNGAPYSMMLSAPPNTKELTSCSRLRCTLLGEKSLTTLMEGALRNRMLRVAVWVHSTTPDRGAICLYAHSRQCVKCDFTCSGPKTVKAASHSGSGDWELLTAAILVPGDAKTLCLDLRYSIKLAYGRETVYFSEPLAILGSSVPWGQPAYLTDAGVRMHGPLVECGRIGKLIEDKTFTTDDGNVLLLDPDHDRRVELSSAFTPLHRMHIVHRGTANRLKVDGDGVLGSHTRGAVQDTPREICRGQAATFVFDGQRWTEEYRRLDYGAVCADDNGTPTEIISQNDWVRITAFASGSPAANTRPSPQDGCVTIGASGEFEVIWTAGVVSTSGDVIEVQAFRRSATPQGGTPTKPAALLGTLARQAGGSPTGGGVNHMSGVAIVSLVAGDSVELHVRNTTAARGVTVRNAGLVVKRVG